MGNDKANCCVPQCDSKGRDIPRMSFHRFPTVRKSQDKTSETATRKLRKQWIHVLKMGQKVSNRMVVCGKHFKETDFIPRSM